MQTLTVDDVAALASRLADTLSGAGESHAAARLRRAVALGGHPAERLLELRSALVTTRAKWADLDDRELVRQAGRVLTDAKRLAIELE